MTAVALEPIFAGLRSEFSSRASNKRIALEFDSTACRVLSDNVCLSQILRNLVDNAIKYTDAGSLKIHVGEFADSVTVVVEDTGRGIAQDDQAKIFSEFYQVPTADRVVTGVGLGLSIVARLTKLLGIELTVRSEVNTGSRFELKIDKVTLDHDASNIDSKPLSEIVPLDDLKTLVVGQETPATFSLTHLLVSWGADIYQLASLDEAVQLLNDVDWLPDMMLIDHSHYQALKNYTPERKLHDIVIAKPVFILTEEDEDPDEDDPADHINRGNHMAIDSTITPMRFRSLVQRRLGMMKT